MKNERNSFTGSLGFVLAAAGSAVGLGNIWRFPYLAARDGGGLFLIIYLILAVTFGFTLLTSEIAIGRKTKVGPLAAYRKICKKWSFVGVFACLVPVMIMPYYVAIGGWVLKYFIAFLVGDGTAAADASYFTGFIGSTTEPIVMMVIFLVLVTFIILRGVDRGIESFSKFIMPVLFILVGVIAVFALTITNTDADGVTRTGLEGLKIYLIPNLAGITLPKLLSVTVDAMGQLFFSLSVAMGIMVAYGSYVKDDNNLVSSINQIEFFDTLVAFLAGVMIIPAVYAFAGTEGLSASGPSLMFISLPKVFAAMGGIGRFIGILFFAMVFFAALTSAVSIMEAIVASFVDQFHMERKKATVIEFVIALVIGVIVCLGYNVLYFEVTMPTGGVGQVLDILDYISNNVLMPIVAICTCILIGWVVGSKVIVDEVEKSGHNFGRKGLYHVMIRWIAPVLLFVLALKSFGILNV